MVDTTMTHMLPGRAGQVLLLLVTALAGGCISTGDIPADMSAQIRAEPQSMDARKVAAIYAPLQEKEPYTGVKVTRDVRYGSAEQNLADIFTATQAVSGPRPVLIFVHGGGFTAGARRLGPDSPFYDNVGVWAARHGMIGVNITYRLAPQARWPAGAQDVGLAVDWVHNSIAAMGGDPRRVFLMGHSAGATHVAGYIGRPSLWNGSGPEILGAIIVSGTFEVTTGPGLPDEKSFVDREHTYFSDAPEEIPSESSAAGLVDAPIPLLFVNAQYDPVYFTRRATELKSVFERAHRTDRFVVLAGESHLSQIMSINSVDTSLSRVIEQFIHAKLRR